MCLPYYACIVRCSYVYIDFSGEFLGSRYRVLFIALLESARIFEVSLFTCLLSPRFRTVCTSRDTTMTTRNVPQYNQVFKSSTVTMQSLNMALKNSSSYCCSDSNSNSSSSSLIIVGHFRRQQRSSSSLIIISSSTISSSSSSNNNSNIIIVGRFRRQQRSSSNSLVISSSSTVVLSTAAAAAAAASSSSVDFVDSNDGDG